MSPSADREANRLVAAAAVAAAVAVAVAAAVAAGTEMKVIMIFHRLSIWSSLFVVLFSASRSHGARATFSSRMGNEITWKEEAKQGFASPGPAASRAAETVYVCMYVCIYIYIYIYI